MYIGVYSILFCLVPFNYIVYFLTIVIVFLNTTVLQLLWQTNFPVCGTVKEY